MFDATEAMLVDTSDKDRDQGRGDAPLRSCQRTAPSFANGSEQTKRRRQGTGVCDDYGQRKGTEEIKDRLDVWRESPAKKRTE